MSKELYLIALVPHEKLRSSIRDLKLEMKGRFDASHALIAPAHITLQMPFRRDEAFEKTLFNELEHFASGQQIFDITLNGFDAFPPRVIFIKIENHQPIIELHSTFQEMLKTSLGFTDKELMSRFHPHLTIATRDLSKKKFQKACPEFKERDFMASFSADGLYLLKHNGKHWELYREFEFGES